MWLSMSKRTLAILLPTILLFLEGLIGGAIGRFSPDPAISNEWAQIAIGAGLLYGTIGFVCGIRISSFVNSPDGVPVRVLFLTILLVVVFSTLYSCIYQTKSARGDEGAMYFFISDIYYGFVFGQLAGLGFGAMLGHAVSEIRNAKKNNAD